MSAAVRIVRQEFEFGRSESALRAPDPRLRRFIVGDYHGWREQGIGMQQTEAPRLIVPVILNFGPSFEIDSPGNSQAGFESAGSFVAGLHDRYAVIRTSGRSQCLQVNFTLGGAARLLGVNMIDASNRIVALGDALGRIGDTLVDELAGTVDWNGRFDRLDSFLLDRLADAPASMSLTEAALRRICSAGGNLSIGGLAADLDVSRKRLIALFRESFGLPPKTIARIVRFERAAAAMAAGADFAMLAADCGYYDQAHFNRDFRDFAGCAPTEFRHLVPAA